MKILITSYFFHPEGTPRATRTYELAKEFARMGHDVHVYVPDYPGGHAGLESRHGFSVRSVPSGYFLNKGDKRADSPASRVLARRSPLKRALYRAYTWLTGGRQSEYAVTLRRALMSNGRNGGVGYGLALSVGLPFAVHLATAKWLQSLPAAERKDLVAIADYGDPYYYSPLEKKFFVHRFLEASALRAFDFVTIPHDRILDSFERYREARGKIRTVPQGFDLAGADRDGYQSNQVPTFAYAGVFYRGKGDPAEMLSWLAARKLPFRFVAYTDTRPGSESMACLAPWLEALGERIELRPRIPRDELIRELSRMDFLVSIDWPGVFHSKLVDYRLAGRPILSWEPGRFEPELLDDFLTGDYRGDFSPSVRLEEYDIRTVAASFLSLAAASS